MFEIKRRISLYFRARSEKKNVIKILQKFNDWQLIIADLQMHKHEKKLALIRLDDIGDYLLTRNFISEFKRSNRYQDCQITLIGNAVWKSIFDEYDGESTHTAIWVDKAKYLNDETYRSNLWKKLRDNHFETVISLSKTRPLLIDDILVLATGAVHKIGSKNSQAFTQLNDISNQIYTNLIEIPEQLHEFEYNKNFTQKVLDTKIQINRPWLPNISNKEIVQRQILCFIGASAKSKTWPLDHWISLIELMLKNGFEPVICGGKNEEKIASQIASKTSVDSIVGKTNLVQTLEYISKSIAVITGDSMAAHAAVSYNKKTIIIANGVNANRFVVYPLADFENVKTIFTKQFNKYIQSRNKKTNEYRAVSSDMQSILPSQVFDQLCFLLKN